jgi:hypothetical protein
MRAFANSNATTIYNLLGFLPAPMVYGLMTKYDIVTTLGWTNEQELHSWWSTQALGCYFCHLLSCSREDKWDNSAIVKILWNNSRRRWAEWRRDYLILLIYRWTWQWLSNYRRKISINFSVKKRELMKGMNFEIIYIIEIVLYRCYN